MSRSVSNLTRSGKGSSDAQVGELKHRCGVALADGFRALDRDAAERGFWEPAARSYVRGLLGIRGDEGVEPPDDRYTPFGLAGAIQAHQRSGEGDRERLRAAAGWTARLVREGGSTIDNYFYGGLWALAAAAVVFDDAELEAAAIDSFRSRREPFLSSTDLNFGVGLWGLSLLHGRISDPEVASAIVAKADALASAVNRRGIPATGDGRAAYHQRMMYATWGLCGAGQALQREDWLAAARRMLEFVVANRVDDDGGIRWHAIREPQARPDGGAQFYPYGKHLYYECHQCFFIVAVELYMEATGSRDFVEVRDRAARWMFGANRWGLDLTTEGPPDLPTRCVTASGRVGPLRNRFKGCYEVGAFLWAMSRNRDGR